MHLSAKITKSHHGNLCFSQVYFTLTMYLLIALIPLKLAAHDSKCYFDFKRNIISFNLIVDDESLFLLVTVGTNGPLFLKGENYKFLAGLDSHRIGVNIQRAPA